MNNFIRQIRNGGVFWGICSLVVGAATAIIKLAIFLDAIFPKFTEYSTISIITIFVLWLTGVAGDVLDEVDF